MMTDRETLRLIGEWLEVGRTRLPEHVVDSVLEQIASNPQRQPVWSARRMPTVNALAKYAIAAAAVVVIVIVGFNVLGSRSAQVGDASPSAPASPSATPSNSLPPSVPASGAIDPGRYRWTSPAGDATVDVPQGWTGGLGGVIGKNADSPADIGFGPNLPGTRYEVTQVYADACLSDDGLEPIGHGVDDLVNALDAQKGTDFVIGDVAAGSVIGKRVEIRQAAGLPDRSSCSDGSDGPLKIWKYADEQDGYYALGLDAIGVVYIFDVNGTRFVFSAAYGPQATADVEELDAIVRSIQLPSATGQVASSPLPAPRLPGSTASPAGEYGFEGRAGSKSQLHRVVGASETALIFKVGVDCLTASERQKAMPVRLAGFDGVSLEPYEPAVSFGSTDGGEITRAHALAVGDLTLCVFLTWYATTTEQDLASAARTLDTLRVEPISDDGIRIRFTLDQGWDTG